MVGWGRGDPGGGGAYCKGGGGKGGRGGVERVLKGGLALAVPTGTWKAHCSWLKMRCR